MPGAHPHAHENAPKSPALVAVITVSDTRSGADDGSGALLAELAGQAGHDVIARDSVPDDIDRIRAAVNRLVDAGADLILLTGGTGLSGRDVTPEAVRPLFQREITGFGELFRWLSWQEIGPAAQFSRATAGVVKGTAVFALPGSPGGCRLAMGKLILPELAHLLTQLRKPAAARPQSAPPPTANALPPALSVATWQEDTEDSPTQAYRVDALDLRSEAPEAEPVATGPAGARVGMAAPTSVAAPQVEGEPTGWQAVLPALGATLDRDRRQALPPEVESIAPLKSVLDEAGQTAALVLPDGRRYSLWGFPDLERRGSKVLAIGSHTHPGTGSTPIPEIVALHRWPFRAGTSVADRPLVPGQDEPVDQVAERVTGRAPRDKTGCILALDRGVVWIFRSNRVYRWDGRKETDEGPVRAALGRMVLQWSQR